MEKDGCSGYLGPLGKLFRLRHLTENPLLFSAKSAPEVVDGEAFSQLKQIVGECFRASNSIITEPKSREQTEQFFKQIFGRCEDWKEKLLAVGNYVTIYANGLKNNQVQLHYRCSHSPDGVEKKELQLHFSKTNPNFYAGKRQPGFDLYLCQDTILGNKRYSGRLVVVHNTASHDFLHLDLYTAHSGDPKLN